MTTLLDSRPKHTGLLVSLLDNPLQFDAPIARSTTQVTKGTREVSTTPRSPPKVKRDLSATPPQTSASRFAFASPPSRKGKESARYLDLGWPEHLAKLKRPGAGLNNPSMACYANATLQILLHTPLVLNQLLQHTTEDCVQNAKAYCLTCALASLAGKHWTHKHYSPNEIHSNLPRIRKGFSRHRQEDTHEFFRFVTDGLQNAALAHVPKSAPEQVKQDTWVYRTWGGQVRSRVVCSKCRKTSDTFDTFLDLSLDVNKGGRPMLLSMLRGFIREDRLEGDNKYHCDHCKCKANATKSFRIARVPPVLTFHLKRFSINYDNGRTRAQKYNQMIDYPEYLDMAPYMIDGAQNSKYRLNGITCHRGAELRFGHYTSYVRAPDGRWYHADDEEMTPVSAGTALNDRTAYVLSYSRIGEDAFPGDRVTIGSKRKLEHVSTESPAKLSDGGSGFGRSTPTAATPSPPPILPTGSPVAKAFGYQPRYTPPIIRAESFYGSGSHGKKVKRKGKGSPMPFARGQRKGMIGKMRKK